MVGNTEGSSRDGLLFLHIVLIFIFKGEIQNEKCRDAAVQ